MHYFLDKILAIICVCKRRNNQLQKLFFTRKINMSRLAFPQVNGISSFSSGAVSQDPILGCNSPEPPTILKSNPTLVPVKF